MKNPNVKHTLISQELDKLLKDKDPSSWEIAYRDYVQNGRAAIDDFLWSWIWYRIEWPEVDYSLFNKDNVYIKCNFLGINILVHTGDDNQRRFVRIAMYESNPYHPDFETIEQVSEEAWRFESIGNPFIDRPNYKWWEQMLFCKLLRQGLDDRKGLDFLIEQIMRR